MKKHTSYSIPNNIIGNDLLLIFLFFINNIEKLKIVDW